MYKLSWHSCSRMGCCPSAPTERGCWSWGLSSPEATNSVLKQQKRLQCSLQSLVLSCPDHALSRTNKLSMIPSSTLTTQHCNKNPIFVFPEQELWGLSPNFHIHVSVSDLYIHRNGPHIFRLQNRQTDHGNSVYTSLKDTWMWKLGLSLRNSFSGEILFRIFGILFLAHHWSV